MKKNKAIFFVCALLVAAIICECLLRFAFPLNLVGCNNFYVFDAEVGFLAKKGYFTKSKDYQLEFQGTQNGFVGFYNDIQSYKQKIFCLGDSYTEGVGVPIDGSYPFFLDFLCNLDSNSTYHKKIAVVNLGLSGRGSLQNEIMLKKAVSLYGNPNYISYMGFDNDNDDDNEFRSKNYTNSIVEGNPKYKYFYGFVKFLFVDLEIGQRLKLLRRNIVSARNYQTSKKTCVFTSEKIVQINDYCKKNNIKFILLWAKKGYCYDEAKRFASKENITFVDWESQACQVNGVLPNLPSSNPHSGGHNRIWQNLLIAILIKGYLK